MNLNYATKLPIKDVSLYHTLLLRSTVSREKKDAKDLHTNESCGRCLHPLKKICISLKDIEDFYTTCGIGGPKSKKVWN